MARLALAATCVLVLGLVGRAEFVRAAGPLPGFPESGAAPAVTPGNAGFALGGPTLGEGTDLQGQADFTLGSGSDTPRPETGLAWSGPGRSLRISLDGPQSTALPSPANFSTPRGLGRLVAQADSASADPGLGALGLVVDFEEHPNVAWKMGGEFAVGGAAGAPGSPSIDAWASWQATSSQGLRFEIRHGDGETRLLALPGSGLPAAGTEVAAEHSFHGGRFTARTRLTAGRLAVPNAGFFTAETELRFAALQHPGVEFLLSGTTGELNALLPQDAGPPVFGRAGVRIAQALPGGLSLSALAEVGRTPEADGVAERVHLSPRLSLHLGKQFAFNLVYDRSQRLSGGGGPPSNYVGASMRLRLDVLP